MNCLKFSNSGRFAQVKHYVEEERTWEKLQKCAAKAEELGVKLQHVHALGSKPKKSHVNMLDSVVDGIDSATDSDGNSGYFSGPSNFHCLLCRRIGITDNGVFQKQIVEHVSNW